MDPLDALQAAEAYYSAAWQSLVDAVAAAKAAGATWADIGEVFGITKQSAWERFAARLPETTNER